MKKHTPPHPYTRGFSLVEVMLSLAIASLGFITLMGLMPQGLQLSRDAANLSAQSRILQKLSGELMTADWKRLDWDGYGPSRYFNDQGVELSRQDAMDRSGPGMSLTYVASVQMPVLPLDVVLPAGTGGGRDPESYLRRMRICITQTAAPDFDFANAPARLVSTHTALLARTGND